MVVTRSFGTKVRDSGTGARDGGTTARFVPTPSAPLLSFWWRLR